MIDFLFDIAIILLAFVGLISIILHTVIWKLLKNDETDDNNYKQSPED